MIDIDDVSKTFLPQRGSALVALTQVSVQIAAGEFITIVGPSGCGKSTLLRVIAGLIRPTAGTVSIKGTPVTGPSSNIGIVFQTPTLLPWASVLDNVLFPLRMTDRLERDSADRASRLLGLVGLEGFEYRTPRELSGGMQQRVAICRALITDPDILLMDEPFGALDALSREEMALELLRIWSGRPKTIVFITHSIPEAVLLADRVIVMSPRPGRVAAIIPVGLPRPRTFAQEASSAFQDCAQHIRTLIFDRHASHTP